MRSNPSMLKIVKRILGIKTKRIDKKDPSLKQYFIDHTIVQSIVTENQERMLQEFERKSTRSWEVSAIETNSDESECYDSAKATILVRGKAKTASVETTDQDAILTH